MSSEKFTPGEWTVACNGNIVFVVVKGTEQENIPDVICSCGINNIYKRKKAAFISVAPEMYKVLKRLVELTDYAELVGVISDAKKILKEARGEEWQK